MAAVDPIAWAWSHLNSTPPPAALYCDPLPKESELTPEKIAEHERRSQAQRDAQARRQPEGTPRAKLTLEQRRRAAADKAARYRAAKRKAATLATYPSADVPAAETASAG